MRSGHQMLEPLFFLTPTDVGMDSLFIFSQWPGMYWKPGGRLVGLLLAVRPALALALGGPSGGRGQRSLHSLVQ